MAFYSVNVEWGVEIEKMSVIIEFFSNLEWVKNVSPHFFIVSGLFIVLSIYAPYPVQL